MKAVLSREPIGIFELPPNPPDQVREAQEHFDRVATQWAELRGERDDMP